MIPAGAHNDYKYVGTLYAKPIATSAQNRSNIQLPIIKE